MDLENEYTVHITRQFAGRSFPNKLCFYYYLPDNRKPEYTPYDIVDFYNLITTGKSPEDVYHMLPTPDDIANDYDLEGLTWEFVE